MSRINIIVAVTNNMVIGKGNTMPWHLPSDLKNFKRVTQNSCVVMGRKCWESIPEKFRPLPNRLNVVLTRDENFKADGAATLSNLERTITNLKNNGDEDEVFVIGGAQIYKEAFPFAERLFITRILADIDGDIILEGLNMDEWELIEDTDTMTENGFNFKFEEYKRKS